MPNRRRDDSSAYAKGESWGKENGKLLYTDKECRHGVALVLWLGVVIATCFVLDLRQEIMTPALLVDGQPVSIYNFSNICRRQPLYFRPSGLIVRIQAWNRLIRFEDINGKERYGEPIDDDLDGMTHCNNNDSKAWDRTSIFPHH